MQYVTIEIHNYQRGKKMLYSCIEILLGNVILYIEDRQTDE